MNKTELIAALAEKSGLSKAASGRALDILLEEITEAVGSGDTVSILGFGSFKSVHRAAREGRNPQTGKKMKIKATTVPKFSPGATLKERVAKAGKKR